MTITVDNELSLISTNPVQNKVVTTAVDSKQDTANLVTTVTSSSTNAQYPSAKWTYDTLSVLSTLLDAVIAQAD